MACRSANRTVPPLGRFGLRPCTVQARLTRPQDIEGMKAVSARFVSDEGWERGLAFKPRATDVIVTPFAKCGTTWMQQIVHGLRSGGDMNFDEISGVVPWIELAHDMQIDLETPQAGHLRAYKSHLGWDTIPKGARYIVVLRDPLDAMVSMYRFFEDWFFEGGTISLDDFADYFLERSEGRDYWSHAMSWWEVRARPDVLVLAYEHMKQDLPGAVAQVADFIDVAEPSVIEKATHQAGFAFMKAHGTQFDDHLTRIARDPACGLPSDSQTSKLGTGKTGQGRPLVSERMHHTYAVRWRDTMGARFGLHDYPSLLEKLVEGRELSAHSLKS